MKTLIILHGWQSSKEKWLKVKEGIEKAGIRVIVPDIPGFKEETKLLKPWNLDNYIEWFKNFLISENISGSFFLLGHSFGGALATKYTLENSDRVTKLFLVAAACVRKKTLKRKVLVYISKVVKKFSFLPFYPLFKKVSYKFIIRNSDYPQAKGFLEDTYLNVIKEDLSPLLAQVKTPTILIWGDKDTITPLKDGQFIKQQIVNSRIEIIQGADHKLNTKNPDELTNIIIKFI